jgi:hypothetical protein
MFLTMKRLLLATALALAAIVPVVAQPSIPWTTDKNDYRVGPAPPLTAERKLWLDRESLADSILYARICPPTFKVPLDSIVQRWNELPEDVRRLILANQQVTFDHVGKAMWCEVMNDIFRMPPLH